MHTFTMGLLVTALFALHKVNGMHGYILMYVS